jgi:hypothetical protein
LQKINEIVKATESACQENSKALESCGFLFKRIEVTGLSVWPTLATALHSHVSAFHRILGRKVSLRKTTTELSFAFPLKIQDFGY